MCCVRCIMFLVSLTSVYLSIFALNLSTEIVKWKRLYYEAI